MDPISRVIFLGGIKMTSYWIASLSGYTLPDIQVLKHATDTSGNIYAPVANSQNTGFAKLNGLGSIDYAKTTPRSGTLSALAVKAWSDDNVLVVSGNNPNLITSGAECYADQYSSSGNYNGIIRLNVVVLTIQSLFDELTIIGDSFSSHARLGYASGVYSSLAGTTRIVNTGASSIYTKVGQVVPVASTNDVIAFNSYYNPSGSATPYTYVYRYNTTTSAIVWSVFAFGTSNQPLIQHGACQLANGSAVFLVKRSSPGTTSSLYIATTSGTVTIASTGDPIGAGDVAADSLGNFYTVVHSATTPGIGYIHKFNSSGGVVWVRSLTGARLHSLSLIDDNTICVSGRTNSGVPVVARLPADGSLAGTYGGFTYAVSSTRFGSFAAGAASTAGGTGVSAPSASAPVFFSAASLPVTPTVTNLS
jgi:hypothetical protein